MGGQITGWVTGRQRRMTLKRAAAATTALAAIAAVMVTPATALAYEQRSNTVSVGIQGGFGFMSGQDDYVPGTDADPIAYETYELGAGLSLNIRYSLDRNHAIGFTFQDLRFDRKDSAERTLPNQFQLNTFLAQYYIYFNRRAKWTRHVVGGLGFHRPTFRAGGEHILPGEGFLANLGVGLEYFVQRHWSIDSTLHGYFIKPKGGSATAAELMVGVHYYFTR